MAASGQLRTQSQRSQSGNGGIQAGRKGQELGSGEKGSGPQLVSVLPTPSAWNSRI